MICSQVKNLDLKYQCTKENSFVFGLGSWFELLNILCCEEAINNNISVFDQKLSKSMTVYVKKNMNCNNRK